MAESGRNETVTLICGESRFEVCRKNLGKKARYFASLFAHNFNDSESQEHVINYDISPLTLESFVGWIQDDIECTVVNYHLIKASLVKFLTANFSDLLQLLQLSDMYIVDDLTNEVIDIIVLNWLLPEKVLDVWLLAQKLSIVVLSDICFSVCLDRFEELPVSKLLELPIDNLGQLIDNVNVRSSAEYLSFVREEWVKNLREKHSVPSFLSKEHHLKEKKPSFAQAIVIHRHEFVRNDPYLYIWDGKILSESIELKNLEDPDKGLVGMQVTGRGFSVYMVGGESVLGAGKFNKVIWRYCLISKKWYYQANLPVPRRHMIAVFLKNKLVIVGGVGRYRYKLSTVDILNIHTGEWSKGAKAPEDFTDLPPHCVMNGKLFYVKSSVYIFDPEYDQWKTILTNHFRPQYTNTILAPGAALFFNGDIQCETNLTRIDVAKESACNDEECLKFHSKHSVITTAKVVYDDESFELRYSKEGMHIMLVNNHSDPTKSLNLQVHSAKRPDLGYFHINPRLGYFNIINPHSLYDKA